jgi:hypothetical protein
VSTCGIEEPVQDWNGDGVIDDKDKSIMSERSSTDLDSRRQWEHGGWKIDGGWRGEHEPIPGADDVLPRLGRREGR